jgi:SAM-dependent methyltransferase
MINSRNVNFYELYAAEYQSKYGEVDAVETVRQWLQLLEREHAAPSPELPGKHERRVLDLGCGPGWHLRAWQRERFAVSGLDSSPTMLRLAARYARAGTGTAIPLYCGDILQTEDIAPLQRRFDVVVAHLNFLNLFAPDELPAVLANVRLMLSMDGVFVADFTVPEHERQHVLIHHPGFPTGIDEEYWVHTAKELVAHGVQQGFCAVRTVKWSVDNRKAPWDSSQSNTERFVAVFRVSQGS